MKRLKAILLLPFVILAEMLGSALFLLLLFGGILAIGVVVGQYVSYWLAAVLALGWAILIFRLRDRFGDARA